MKKLIIILAVLLIVIGGAFVFLGKNSNNEKAPSLVSDESVREISITAKQWEFVPGTITVQQGERVRLSIASVDVAHGFALPDFGISEYLTPGQTSTVEFTADKKGTFSFFCNVVCGAGHSQMRGVLVVQ